MRNKAGVLQLRGETFPYDVLVCLGVDRNYIIEYIEQKFGKILSDEEKAGIVCEGKGRTLATNDGWLILWVLKYPNTAEGFGHLAHEIFHTADLMLRKSVHATLSDDSDEVWAYQVDWLTRRIYHAFGFVNTPKPKR